MRREVNILLGKFWNKKKQGANAETAPGPGAKSWQYGDSLWHCWSLEEQFSPQIFTCFPHIWQWILSGLKMYGSVAAHTESTEVSWTLWFCRGESLLACCTVKAKFCSLQNTSNTATFLNAFYLNFQHVYPPVFPHLITNRWFNKNINNPHQHKSRWKGVSVKMFFSLNSVIMSKATTEILFSR